MTPRFGNSLRLAVLVVLVGGLCTLIWSANVGMIVVAALVFLAVSARYESGRLDQREKFYSAYAQAHGLNRTFRPLGSGTPLLRRGSEQRLHEQFEGPLVSGFSGSVSFWTYRGPGKREGDTVTGEIHPFTIVRIHIPELSKRLSMLVVERRDDFVLFDGVEDSLRSAMSRVIMESARFNDRFEIFVAEKQDPNFVRQLFSPTFIDWMTYLPNRDYAFESGGDHLFAYVPWHLDNADDLDRLVEDACELAARLRSEAIE